MHKASLEDCLRDLQLPEIRYFQSIDSTNDEAWRWVESSAPHAALVVADEQTAGRGRFTRKWVTTAGSGLAFSLVLRPPAIGPAQINRLSGLAAMAICKSFLLSLHIPAQIKWPNDILLDQRKAAGILAETRWEGEDLVAVVMGIGINIAPESVDPHVIPPSGWNFPATCVEDVVGHRVDRWDLLHAILVSFFSLLPGLDQPAFIDEWYHWLAYRGQSVELSMGSPGRSSLRSPAALTGVLVGLNLDGSLKILSASGELVTIQVGELQLRPVIQPENMEKDQHV